MVLPLKDTEVFGMVLPLKDTEVCWHGSTSEEYRSALGWFYLRRIPKCVGIVLPLKNTEVHWGGSTSEGYRSVLA